LIAISPALGRQLDGIQDDTTFSFFATKHAGSTAFLFAEEVISFPTIERLAKDKKSADIATGVDTIMEYLLQSVTEVVEFVNSYLGETLEAYGIPVIRIRDKLDAHFLADPEKTFTPLFVRKPEDE
jgi:hypothetical protein